MYNATRISTGIHGPLTLRLNRRAQRSRCNSVGSAGSSPTYRTMAEVMRLGWPCGAFLLRRAPIDRAGRPTAKVTVAKIPSTVCTEPVSAARLTPATGAFRAGLLPGRFRVRPRSGCAATRNLREGFSDLAERGDASVALSALCPPLHRASPWIGQEKLSQGRTQPNPEGKAYAAASGGKRGRWAAVRSMKSSYLKSNSQRR